MLYQCGDYALSGRGERMAGWTEQLTGDAGRDVYSVLIPTLNAW